MPMVKVSNGGTSHPICILGAYNTGGYWLYIEFLDGESNSVYNTYYMESQSANFENDFIKVTSSGYSWTIQFKKAAVGYAANTGLGNVGSGVAPTTFTVNQTVTPGLAKGYVIMF